MSGGTELREWVGYSPTWLIIGIIGLLLLAGWYGFVLFSTRRRPQKTLTNLAPKAYTPPDLTLLKQKYLQLIAEVEQKHSAGGLTARAAHQKLSYLLRMFVYEIRGHRVDTLTLEDLQKTRYTALTGAIATFYMPEFTAVQRGDVASALALARKVVTEWT